MATTAHRARDRGASRDRRSLSESGRDRGTAAGRMGTATAGKTGQRGRADHRVGRGKTDRDDQPQPQPRKPFFEGKSKTTSKPANENEVTTGLDAAIPTETINPNPEFCRSYGLSLRSQRESNWPNPSEKRQAKQSD